jgi:hypothetical protein
MVIAPVPHSSSDGKRSDRRTTWQSGGAKRLGVLLDIGFWILDSNIGVRALCGNIFDRISRIYRI